MRQSALPLVCIATKTVSALTPEGMPMEIEEFHSAYINISDAVAAMGTVSTNILGQEKYKLWGVNTDTQARVLLGQSD